MGRSFSMSRMEVTSSDAATLRAAILAATGDEGQTASILRSLERMGTDASILSFEITEVASPRQHASTYASAWRVRADRGGEDSVP